MNLNWVGDASALLVRELYGQLDADKQAKAEADGQFRSLLR